MTDAWPLSLSLSFRFRVSRQEIAAASVVGRAHLLCKHLVQAVGTPPPHFWTQVHRRRVTPVYRHSALRHSAETTSPEALEDLSGDHSITDGEDLEDASSVERYARRKGDNTLLAKVRLLDWLLTDSTILTHIFAAVAAWNSSS